MKRTAALAALLLAAVPGAGARAIPAAGDQLAGNIQTIASISYSGGSDLEFATKTVKVLDESGQPVCVLTPTGECQVDGDGNVVYLTEERDYVFLGRLSNNVFVVDITDPANPVKVAEIPCRLNQNDVQVSGDVLVMAADTSGNCTRPQGGTVAVHGFATADISDPRFPKYIGKSPTITRGAHNTTVHPTKPIVYVSNSDNAPAPGEIHIYDITDPVNPALVQNFNYMPAMAPHDVTFRADGNRAYAASRLHTDILDTTDPKAPVLISTIPHAGYLSHQSDPTPDGDYLLVSEELLGGGQNTPSPGGPVHVWDIRDEAHPVEIGAFAIDSTGMNGVSTSHVFRINPDGYTMAIAWYNDGVHVLDYSGVIGVSGAGTSGTTGMGARTIGSAKLANADTWSAKMWQERHPGYVFANDINRGFDVFYVPELGPTFLGTGTIHGGHLANYTAGVGVTRAEFENECAYSPRTNGVDGWVAPIPAPYGDGTWELTAKARIGNPARDLDLFFYDESCSLLLLHGPADTDTFATIPEGSKYVMVANYTTGTTNVSLALTVKEAPVEEL